MGGLPYPIRSAENYVIISFTWCLLCMAHGSDLNSKFHHIDNFWFVFKK